MAIKFFVLFLLVLSAIGYFIPVEDSVDLDKEKDIPMLTFNDSTMYTLTTESMNRVIFAQKALRYSDRDVMYNGSLMMKNKDNPEEEITDLLFSDIIIKRENKFKFLNNVKFTRNDYITVNTDELLYDSETKIATNTLPFDGLYYNNYLKGKNVYLDLNSKLMKAKNTHFEIEVQE